LQGSLLPLASLQFLPLLRSEHGAHPQAHLRNRFGHIRPSLGQTIDHFRTAALIYRIFVEDRIQIALRLLHCPADFHHPAAIFLDHGEDLGALRIAKVESVDHGAIPPGKEAAARSLCTEGCRQR